MSDKRLLVARIARRLTVVLLLGCAPFLPSGAAADAAPPLGVYMDTLPDGTRGFPHEKVIEHFEELTGTDVTLVLLFLPRDQWSNIQAPAWMFRRLARWLEANPDRGAVVSVPPFPAFEGAGGPGLRRCAAGRFNPRYELFGQRMRDDYRLDRLVLRFGWEWNGGWYPWGTDSREDLARDFAACFRNFVDSVNRAFPENRFVYEWTATTGASNQLLEAAWPGDAYVDIVGVAAFDAYWQDDCDRYDGPCRWSRGVGHHLQRFRAFAQVRGKPLGISEWGVWNVGQQGDDGRGGGDNAHYIERMCEFIRDPANNVAYSAYFEDDAGGDHRLYAEKNRRALAAFRQHCRGAPTADLGPRLAGGGS